MTKIKSANIKKDSSKVGDNKEFESRNKKFIEAMYKDKEFMELTKQWFKKSWNYEYQYHFSWLGLPILQFPQDIMAIQELIWKIKPDLIIETGIARGGSIILSSSILELIGKGEVVGIDIDIREHNKKQIKKHPLFKRITMIEGSSVSKKIIKKVYEIAKNKSKVLVMLDSNHTHKHVLNEMKAYAPLIKKGSYMLVMDTMIEDLPKNFFKNRPSNIGNNPRTAVEEFLKSNKKFKIDKAIEKKLLITASPNGFLKCIK